tara:strand:+ start:124 stop:321 length:198 start_codon:yes stop_codon:yes gene_type:complete
MNKPEIKYRIKYFLMSSPSEVIEKELLINSESNIRDKFKEEIGMEKIEIISLEKLNNGSWKYCTD